MKKQSTKMRWEGTPPEHNHLIVEHRPGAFLALLPGSKMGIVIDPTERNFLHKLALYSVTEQKICFKCMCNPTCEVILEYKQLPVKGSHAK